MVPYATCHLTRARRGIKVNTRFIRFKVCFLASYVTCMRFLLQITEFSQAGSYAVFIKSDANIIFNQSVIHS